jgi:Uma2 family endonuclease
MTAVRKFIPLSVDDYLSGEQLSDVKQEYIDGRVYAMAGASWWHNRVAMRFYSKLEAHLEGTPTTTLTGDMKVRMLIKQKDLFYYPDVVVTCDPRDTGGYFLRFPKLVIEVLSESTERLDRTEKRENYQTLPSLEEYVLVSQDQPEVTIFRRRANWEAEINHGLEAVIHLESVELHLPLATIYAGLLER